MTGAIVILGTLDTKGIEIGFLRSAIVARGVDTIVVDAGILEPPAFPPDVDRHAVAAAGGVTVEDLVLAGDRGQAVTRMAEGAARVVADLHAQGKVAGIIGIGGSGNAAIASAAMRALPIGVPKLLVSTMAAGDTRPYMGTSDITMMYSVVDIAGLNRLSRRILGNAAAAIAGMAAAAEPSASLAAASPLGGPREVAAAAAAPEQFAAEERPLVAATMFGVTTPCVTAARERLEALGYEVLVFHATGVGGRAMETLVRDGFLAGVLDITTTELADEVAGGTLSAGPDRLEAAGQAGIPQVVSLGALDMANFGPIDTVPERFRARLLYRHNPTVTLMRTTPEENATIGRLIAEKLNRARGPVALVVPLRGVSMIDAPGAPFFDAEADAALFSALRAHLESRVEMLEVDAHINDPAFADALVQTFHRLVTG